MESLAAFPNGEWDSFNKLFSFEDHLDFPHQILHQLEHDEGLSFMNYPSSVFPNPQLNEIFLPLDSDFDHYDSHNIAAMNGIPMINSFPAALPNITMEDYPSRDVLLADNKRVKLHAEGDIFHSTNSIENTKKRPRVSKDESRKKRKNNVNGNERECNKIVVDHQGHSSSTTCSSDDDNIALDINSNGSPALNLNGKTRASRGSATDPQSLYARKRRERINERLRILQNLVPNGTKVDISTMLEEAVHYVKFLQLQIKLLSSDELWMYAPIAYNGVDVGLNEKFSTFL